MCNIYELSKHCSDQRVIIKCSLRQYCIFFAFKLLFSPWYLLFIQAPPTFQGRTNYQTLSKAEHATKSIHRPCALSKSLSERAPRHDQIFFRTTARPNYVFLQPSTQDQLFYCLFFLFFLFFHEQTLPQVEHMTKKILDSNTRPKIHKNQDISQVQFTTKHFLRSITQVKIY